MRSEALERGLHTKSLYQNDLYASKVLEDVGLLMIQTSFKSRNIKKIDPNIEIINKILFKDHKNVTIYQSD